MLDSELHFLLLKCFHCSQKMIVQQTAKLDLCPGQPKILECLYEMDGQTPKDIGKKCVLDKSTMTSLLKKMELQGLIYRQEQPDDKRSVRIFMTELGREKAEKVMIICRSVDRLAFENIPLDLQQELVKILGKVLYNFEVDDRG